MNTQRIVICDDEELLCVTVADFLRGEGYRVSVVHDGVDLLPVIAQEPVDLVLLDLMMPRMNGIATLARIKKDSPLTRVIMLSGYGSEENIRESERLGSDGFINKPFGVETLIRHIKSVLAQPSRQSFIEPPIG